MKQISHLLFILFLPLLSSAQMQRANAISIGTGAIYFRDWKEFDPIKPTYKIALVRNINKRFFVGADYEFTRRVRQNFYSDTHFREQVKVQDILDRSYSFIDTYMGYRCILNNNGKHFINLSVGYSYRNRMISYVVYIHPTDLEGNTFITKSHGLLTSIGYTYSPYNFMDISINLNRRAYKLDAFQAGYILRKENSLTADATVSFQFGKKRGE